MNYELSYDLDDGRGVQKSIVSVSGQNGDFRGARHEELADLIEAYDLSFDAVANGIGISKKALDRKIRGKEGFSWNQVCLLQEKFFPGLSKEEIMQ